MRSLPLAGDPLARHDTRGPEGRILAELDVPVAVIRSWGISNAVNRSVTFALHLHYLFETLNSSGTLRNVIDECAGAP